MLSLKFRVSAAVAFCIYLASGLTAAGQNALRTVEDFATARAKAEGVLKQNSYVLTSIEEIFDDRTKAVVSSATRTKEVIPPDRERIKAVVTKDRKTVTYFSVRINDTLFMRREGDAWQKMENAKTYGGPIPGAMSTAKVVFEGMTQIFGTEARLYKVSSSSRYGIGTNERIISTDASYWIDTAGRYLKTVDETHTNVEGLKRTTSTYSYTGSFTIEPPIK